MEQPAAGDDQRRRIVVELAEAVGRLRRRGAGRRRRGGRWPGVVRTAALLRTLPAAGERGAGAHGRGGVVEVSVRMACPASTSGRPRTLSAPLASASCARNPPWWRARVVTWSVTRIRSAGWGRAGRHRGAPRVRRGPGSARHRRRPRGPPARRPGTRRRRRRSRRGVAASLSSAIHAADRNSATGGEAAMAANGWLVDSARRGRCR